MTRSGYALPVWPFKRPPELAGETSMHPVVIVGAGLAGLTAACEFSLLGIPAVLVDDDDTVGVRGASSRGICYAQKSLEIFSKLGILERVVAKGVQWSVGRTLAGDDEVYAFDLRKQPTHSASIQPPFVNLQQFYIEWFLVDQIVEMNVVDLRWRSRATGLVQDAHGVTLHIETDQGNYDLRARYCIDASGLHSPLRKAVGALVETTQGEDRWCIADVRFAAQAPAERWTWIEAPFNHDRAVWQHLMADDVWRLDYQMEPNADMAEVARPEVIDDRLKRQFGADVKYELVWAGPYGYRTQCLDRFRVGRVLFAGDAAHVISPFGARGGNSAIQDADNLAWKLARVLDAASDETLLESYATERRAAALENIAITRRTTRFLRPPTRHEQLLRDAVIELARVHPFARAFVNTGRMSTPNVYEATEDVCGVDAIRPLPNLALAGPKQSVVAWFSEHGWRPILFVFGNVALDVQRIESEAGVGVVQPAPLEIARTLAISTDCAIVVRPDLYIAAKIESPTTSRVIATAARALSVRMNSVMA